MINIQQTEWKELIANDTNAVVINDRTPSECAEYM